MEAAMENGNSIEVVRREVMSIPDQAKLIVVKDQGSMTRANECFLIIKGLRKKIAETMDPIISAAFAAHKVAVGKKKELEAPLILGESWLNGQMTAYHQEQERIRRAEEEKLRQEAIAAELKRREEEEARKMAEAAALEAQGAKEEAEQLVNEAIQAKEEPVVVEVKAPETPKVVMTGAAVKKYWDFEIVNETLIPREYLKVDETKIGGIVRALKEKANIPGVRVFQRSGLAATGR
jgi:hypothetical protein